MFCNFAVADEELPFRCHNTVPKDTPQPSTDINNFQGKAGVSPKIKPSAIPSDTVYAQFQAASALVPCDEDPVSIFIPKTLLKNSSNPHGTFSVAVIYTDKSSTMNLKYWLKWVDQTECHF